jgi:O-antigen ligase
MMRNAYRTQRPAASMATRLKRVVRDNSYFWIITAMFWAVFYENLPANIGEPESTGLASIAAFSDAAKGAGVAGPDVVARMIKFGMLGISGYLIAIRWSSARALVRNMNPGLLALYGLAGLSMMWSIDSSATGLRFVSFSAVMFACFAFGLASWHERRFQQVVVPPLLLILALSLVVGAVDSKLVTEIGESISLKGSWRGITHTKNEFGMLSCVAVIVCMNAWIANGIRTWWAVAGTVVAGLCLMFSRSSTSMLAAGLAVTSMFLVMRVPVIRQRYTTHVAVSVAALILLYELVIQNVIPGMDVLLAPVTAMTGKDTTFSARTVIWKIIKDHIQLSPYLGTGYGGYWVGPVTTSPSYIFVDVMSWYPTESHNGYLEVVNDLGMLGLGVVLLFIYFYIRQALQLMRTDRAQAALYLALLFQEMVMNMSESEWISRSDTFMVLTLGSVSMARALQDLRLRGAGVGGRQPAQYGPRIRGKHIRSARPM